MSEDLLINLTDEQKQVRITESENIIIAAEKAIELAKTLKRFKASKEFKIIIESEYFEEYAKDIFKEMTNPKQFATIPLENCEDTLTGIKALKAFVGFESNLGIVELDAQNAERRKTDAEKVLNAIG